MKLPESMLVNADRTSDEAAWALFEFPKVLDTATDKGLACIGGQFQFRGPIGIAEMYWLNADSMQQFPHEDWNQYVERANREVRIAFDKICSVTDFDAEAAKWGHIREAIESGKITDPTEHLYFVAYFSPEPTKAQEVSP